MNGFLRILSICLFSAISVCHATVAEVRHSGVRLRVEVPEQPLVVGQAMYVRFEVFNEEGASQGVYAYRPYFSESNDVEIYIQRPGELPYRYDGNEETATFGARELDVAPGRSSRQDFPVIFERRQPNGYVFASPGEYRIRARFSGKIRREPDPTVVETPFVPITVRAAEGKNATAFKLIADKNAARVLQGGLITADSRTVSALDKLVAEFPDTPYAPPCAYALSLIPITGAKIDFAKGAELSRQFYQKYPNDVRSSNAMYNMAFCYRELKQSDTAREWLYQLQTLDPSFYRVAPEDPLFRNLMITAPAGFPWYLYQKPWDALARNAAKARQE